MISFDTNILVYAIDLDEEARHPQAAALIERAMGRGACVQTLQSFAEFYNVVTRRMSVAPDRARAFVDGWRSVFPVEAASAVDFDHAMRAVGEYKLAFWDAMLWATARRIGISVLISEDFQDGRVIEGVRFANPFAPQNAPIIDAALRV